ncbi:MAG: N-acetylmuramoyl-L-alanine amidase-like domain-containing protein, partial [Gemmatimonadaceae bacterium]
MSVFRDCISRRDLLRSAAAATAAFALPSVLGGCKTPRAEDNGDPGPSADLSRLSTWSGRLRAEGLTRSSLPVGRAGTRVGELAIGTPYKAFTLESYIKAGGDPTGTEPLTLSLTEFDCVSLVEGCLGVARTADGAATPSWNSFGREVERMRYRNGERGSYATRLHYFSEWITDGARRGLVRDLAPELGGVEDARPLRFMTEHRASYPALANDKLF